MKVKSALGLLLLFLAAAPAYGQDEFHVAYRQENVAIEGNMVTGSLLVSVYNVSGAEARDVAVSIPGPNNVTYDNRVIFIGNLDDGQRVEELDVFSVPVEMRRTGDVDEQAVWDVEFTATSGERKKVRITGRNARISN